MRAIRKGDSNYCRQAYGGRRQDKTQQQFQQAMTDVANFLFATEVQTSRPETTPNPTPARNPLTISPYRHLKELKERARLTEQSYRTQMMSHHRVQRSFEEITRKSLLKRVEFLKIYGNKKAKYQGREMLDTSKREAEILERKSMEMVKRRKLENELQLILVKNEEEDHALQIAMMARREKELLQKRREIALQRDQASHRHDEVKKGHTEFLIRKKNIQTSQSMRSRKNYMTKVYEELSLINQYERVIGDIENMCLLNDGDDLPGATVQTLDPPGKSFFTTNNTISV